MAKAQAQSTTSKNESTKDGPSMQMSCGWGHVGTDIHITLALRVPRMATRGQGGQGARFGLLVIEIVPYYAIT